MNQCFLVPTIHLTLLLLTHFYPSFLFMSLPQMLISSSNLSQHLNGKSDMQNSFDQTFQIFSSIIASSANNSFLSNQLAQLTSAHMPSIQPIPLQSALTNIGAPTLSPSNGNHIYKAHYSDPSHNPTPSHGSSTSQYPLGPTLQTNQLSTPLAHPINESPISNLKLTPTRKYLLLTLLKIARRRVYLIKDLHECWIEQNENADKRKDEDVLSQRIRLHQSEFGRMDRDERRIKIALGPVRISQLKKLFDQYVHWRKWSKDSKSRSGWLESNLSYEVNVFFQGAERSTTI